MRDIEEIRAELREAEAALASEERRRKESVKPKYRFTLLPPTRRDYDLYDDTCRVYVLNAELLNEEALREVGAYIPSTGSMAYLFNKGTGRIVAPLGGGTIYVSKAFGQANDDSDKIAMRELSEFLIKHPGGGDVTEIVEAHRRRRGNE